MHTMMDHHAGRNGGGRRRLLGAALAASLLGVGALASVPSAGAATATTAAAEHRVDRARPVFSHPTRITNPLFPKDRRTQVLQLGTEGADTVRFEVTQMPGTRSVPWRGQRIRTVVTHFVAYTNDRLVEVAWDYYAQADDGAVWYFGEDVDNYENGVLVNHDGTWLAGRDGPPGMIMPARPRVGDVFRPENILSLAFEESTVTAVGLTVNGPRGTVQGAIRARTRLLDGTIEEKIYAPGYGEFTALVPSADETYGVALAVPRNTRPGALPQPLAGISDAAERVFDAVGDGQWVQARDALRAAQRSWQCAEPGLVPSRLRHQMRTELAALADAVGMRSATSARQGALDVRRASLDVQLIYRSHQAVDRDRLALWRDQLMLDRAAGDPGLIAGDRATIAAISERLRH